MTEYVAGFMFNEERTHVALIIKNRPVWQAGNANGIGGHIEDGEAPLEAMVREFEEETGVRHLAWEPFIILSNAEGAEDEWIVHFFQAVGDLSKLETTTDESVVICEAQRLPHNCVPNLKWLVPLASLNEVVGCLSQRR